MHIASHLLPCSQHRWFSCFPYPCLYKRVDILLYGYRMFHFSFFNACDLRPRNKSKSRKAYMLDLIDMRDLIDLLDIIGSLTWLWSC